MRVGKKSHNKVIIVPFLAFYIVLVLRFNNKVMMKNHIGLDVFVGYLSSKVECGKITGFAIISNHRKAVVTWQQ